MFKPELQETKVESLPIASLETLKALREEMCSQSVSRDFKIQNHQRFLRRILSPDSSTRSLLMVHGTGTGKTCSAIQIAEEYIIRPEFQESKVEKVYDLIQNHFKNLEDKKYIGTFRLFIDYVSWQYNAVLKGPLGENDLVVTNKGICPGLNYSQENKFFTFFADACYLFTSGGVSSDPSQVTYIQDNVLATGVKTSLGLGYFVSSSRSEIGFKLPIIYAIQNLENPPGGYEVQEGSNLLTMIGVYSRWPIGSYFFQTEFSKYLTQDQLLWSLGFGYKF
jgi:hypothetical protein